MDYIKIKEKKDVLHLGIMDEKGNIVKDKDGNEVCLSFDLADIELVLKYNECVNQIENARRNLRTQFLIIEKKQDHKGKQLLSSNEMAKVKAFREFYKEMEKAMDMFLGEGGTRKFLNGRNPYYEMFDDISEAIKPYLGQMELTVKGMTDRIKNKYKVENDGVLKND